MAKQDDYSRYTIRVPQKVYQALESAAYASGRSINAEIIDRLQWTLEAHDNAKAGSGYKSQDQATIDILNRTIEDKSRIIELQDQSIDKERLTLRKTAEEYIDLLWEILGNSDEIPPHLVVNAELKLAKFEDDPEAELTFEEEQVLQDPDSREAKEVIANIIERARLRYKNKMMEIEKIFSSIGRNRNSKRR
ncbi:Arc family DNA-binding protein [Agrobacterium tumefaciens]|uniref:Arc family DNA-binding protein n=1 Tax=Agrobacterium tumefaciens TaxID=358 RepID=A0AA44F1J1_AGRTU|nr:Arc family DNA-binding protein [Agrobacterium tumefaciens]NTB84103.1 Arc family DNA-binding protein [Agrobacterium tumefaciens]NTC20204.1 Arc family DNA-binding protein [Agrobacterium tumefaciens]NTC27405.1 Arc family DNA-binding protein [Agrobacterium tumefaciens]NTD87000.1 Arc family DNA-binding protein [Agrobacterium tumefaciens]NTD95420.1 Arc family DNA-binding protein [Agrobacterium tumefaciens]